MTRALHSAKKTTTAPRTKMELVDDNQANLDNRANAPFVVSSAGYHQLVEHHILDEATLLKIENGEEDVHGLIIESYMILDEVDVDEDGADYILLPWADV